MEIAVVVDGSRPRELAHGRTQAARLRRAGLRVVGLSKKQLRGDPDCIGLLYAVGPGGWRSARRLARQMGKPIAYDHPFGATPPAKLGKADVVVASSYRDATALRRRLRERVRLVVVPPDPPPLPQGIRPRLRRRLGIGGQTVALQEAATVSHERAEALIHAVSSLSDIDLVFLGGDRWDHRDALVGLANDVHAVHRVHFVSDVPSARRIEYLREADLGLAFADMGYPEDRLPAADVFEMLGIPYVSSPDELDPEPRNRIASGESHAEVCGAIMEASARPRMPVRDDGTQLLAGLVVDVASDGKQEWGPARTARVSRSSPLSSSPTALLEEAKALRERGDREGALALFLRVASGSHPPDAIATAAAGLARLNARAEAETAVERVLATHRPPLATVRVGEAAALLGDLPQARACVDEVLADATAPALALRAAIRVLEQSGEPRTALRVARQAVDEASVARIEGALASYDPTWLPLPGRRSDGGVSIRPQLGRSFTLLETSLPHARSGYTYRAQTLLRAQQRVGVQPTVLTRLGFPATRGLRAPPVEEVDGVVHHRASLPAVKRYTSVPVSEQLEENVRWAAALGREIQPEGIIAATPHLNGLIGLALRKLLGVPVVYDVRGFPEMTWAVRKGGRDADVFGLRRIAETRCMLAADLVTTLSETMREHIVSRGVPAEKVFVLPHAVDITAFAPSERDPGLMASLGFAGRPVVGYISSLVGYEGVDTLLEAIALARMQDPSIAGLIVGDGELRRSLEAQAKRLGLDGHVVFTGRVEAGEISRYYSLTDIFVCPRQDHEVTRYVTPLKPFEAMAAGCCLLSSDLPTLREAVRDGECGVLFPAGDADALAASILALIEQPERRRRLMTAAREHAVANHGFDTLSSCFEALWEELRRRSRLSSDGGMAPGPASPAGVA